MSKTSILLTILVVSAITIAVIVWTTGNSIFKSGHAYTANLVRGQSIYMKACASCHGKTLEGQPDWKSPGADGRLPAPPHDETGHTWHHSDRILLAITKLGTETYVGGNYKSNMPGFGKDYSDGELRDVIEWIKSQWPDREKAYQAEVSKQDPITE